MSIRITLPGSATAVVPVPPALTPPANEVWGVVCLGRSAIAGTNGGALTRPFALCETQFVLEKLHRAYLATPNDFSNSNPVPANEQGAQAMPVWGPGDAITRAYRGQVPVFVGNFATSGISLNNLVDKAGNQWLGLISWLDRFAAVVTAQGKIPRVKYLYYSHQDNNSAYTSIVQQFYADVQEAIKSRTGQAEDVRWLWQQGGSENLSRDSARILADDPAYNVTVVFPGYQMHDRLSNDPMHYSSEEHLRTPEVMRVICDHDLQGTWKEFRLTGLTQTGPRTIVATFDTVDDFGPIDIRDNWHGIEVYSNGTRLPQAAGAVTGPREITLTFPEDLTGALTGGIARTAGLYPNVPTSGECYTGVRVQIGQSTQTGEPIYLHCISMWFGAVT